ncbi:YbjQ family protein [Methanosphaera cuniculi]|uniref:YbjQ family protein n=1 Tax=Methanosphaera cuniculi TaxID=1077256 RepID=UPI0026EAA259|nr:YbjQ family protein [Methanosphaera cuniculi]
MIILTTPNIQGKKVAKYHGIVNGEGLIGANVYKDIFSGVRDVVGGRTSTYEIEIQKAREAAIERMTKKAEELGANAILNVRINYSNLGGTMGNTILISVNGTAVTFDDIDDDKNITTQ